MLPTHRQALCTVLLIPAMLSLIEAMPKNIYAKPWGKRDNSKDSVIDILASLQGSIGKNANNYHLDVNENKVLGLSEKSGEIVESTPSPKSPQTYRSILRKPEHSGRRQRSVSECLL